MTVCVFISASWCMRTC